MIRQYKISDRPELIEIFKLNTPAYFDPKEINDLEEYLDQNSDTYFTVEYENKIIGGAGYQITDNNSIGRITWIFFHPDYSGHGYGRQAVGHCLTILKSNPKLKKLIVTTSQLAYKFFAKFGYTLTRIEKDYWGIGLDLYVMETNLINKK